MQSVNLFFATLFYLTAQSIYGFVIGFIHINQKQPKLQTITEDCFKCIVVSISLNNGNLTCGGDLCGLFGITRAYWADSGKPVVQKDDPNDNYAYSRCAKDPACAKEATNSYLTRFAQDCNGDGFIDCSDYASIHKLGGYNCSAPLDNAYKNKYYSCYKNANRQDDVQVHSYILPLVIKNRPADLSDRPEKYIRAVNSEGYHSLKKKERSRSAETRSEKEFEQFEEFENGNEDWDEIKDDDDDSDEYYDPDEHEEIYGDNE
ncbi:EF-Hand 1, calcium-binding site,Destabilase [Cinara cedri]|uniref:lysozyme n=1 Tax=Cinara cedri TaxID=506608 RepID=A0A5E4MJZ7_9HEMI|nr:EF-Hand 1, calcium-binding site,Destabilase [Cinara cedri]